MQRILRFLTFFVMFVVGTNAWSAAYVCTDSMTYTSCSNGYYVSDCDDYAPWSGQTLTESDVNLGNSCEPCPTGYTCTGGLACPTKSSAQSGYLCDDAKRYVSCPAGEYLSDCGDSSSNWVGQTLDKSELVTGNACVSCPDDYTCVGGATCPIDYQFELTTVAGTDSFSIYINAAGNFVIDWGDGNVEPVINETPTYNGASHTYAMAGTYTIKIAGAATGYSTSSIDEAISFSTSASKIASIDGSLGAIFPTLDDGSQPVFFNTFRNATSLTEVPGDLFAGVTGAAENMFYRTFEGCTGLTEIPADLFSGVSGAAENMFYRTFYGCTGLTEIPDGLFSGITGAAPEMFDSTFYGCTGLSSIPDGLFSGVTGAADYMFESTFSGCTGLTKIPADLFSGITGAAEGMFDGTFFDCTNLTSIPDGLFSGVTGAAASMFSSTFTGCRKLSSIPDGLFSGVSGAADYMFSSTFSGCTNLTSIPDGLFSGVSGAADYMFMRTFTSTNITSIPDGLFDGVYGVETLPENMFYHTFYNDSALTGPAARMSADKGGQFLHEIWPMDGATWETYTGTNIDNLAYIPTSWGGGGQTITCVAGQYLPANATACVTCPAGNYCAGLTGVVPSTADQGLTTCPAGSYCVAESTEPMACPAGYTSGDATGLTSGADCFGGHKFEIETTDDLTGEFSFTMMGVKGDFLVDWGDGEVQKIVRDSFDEQTIKHTYTGDAQKRTIRFGGLATEYDTTASGYGFGVIKFTSNPYISKLSGSLGKIFPTLADGSQPGFFKTFMSNTSLTSIPDGLFDDVYGAADYMFSSTFAACVKLTEIPVGLFDGITGAAEWMFENTFWGCRGLTEIPADLFSGVSGAADGMFASTFNYCTNLTSIPDGLFDGVAGTETLPDYMFSRTFYDNTSLTGPAARMSAAKGGKFLHEIWPMTGETLETYTGATGLTDWDYIPPSWGGGGYVDCAAGTYLPANATTCATCPAGSYCGGLTGVATSTENQGINACPVGYTNTETGLTQGADCFGGYQFAIETTDDLTGEFLFTMVSVKGNFWVDWGDGEVQKIVRDSFDEQRITHTYTGDAQKRTIRFGGLATEYDTTATAWGSGVIKFQGNQHVSKLSGSLGKIFPTLSDGSQPGFWIAFSGNANLTEIPAKLFDGISGTPREMMFYGTFAGCASLTKIPDGLFDGVYGAASRMFEGTFNGCTKLSSIPDGLFSGVTGVAEGMFASTFGSCTGLMEIPDGLFDGVAGAETLPDGMFHRTFYHNTSLTGPAAKMSADKGGQFLHDIWPMTGAAWETYTGATGLTDWEYIPTSWGGGGQAITCAGGTYLPANATECAACPAGNYCAGLTGVVPSTADQGLTTCPAGSYCVAESTEPMACPAGYTSGNTTGLTQGVDCFGGYQFGIETTDNLTGEFLFKMMGVKGDFWVDWGDGEVQKIVSDSFDEQTITHTYTGDAQKRTIRFGGSATEYDTTVTAWNSGVIKFQDNQYISKLSGSLGKIFPTLSDGSQPVFMGAFANNTNLTEIPDGLFSGVSGAAAGMFMYTFAGCTGLTEIPDGLFSDVTGAAVAMFASTFLGCTGLSSIPDGLFSGVTGAAGSMFSGTFYECTGLSSIPDGLFSGVSGAADYMFDNTFYGCTNLTSIPDGLFDGVAGVETLPESMFQLTFAGCTALTGPAAKMSADKGGKFLHEIWPMTGATWNTYTGATGLTDWDYIPLSWGGGGRITCAAGQYIAKGGSTCTTCKAGYYCLGGDLTSSTTADVGLTRCPADSFCVAGVSAPTTCASVNDGLYPKSSAGATAATSCYLPLAPNQYIDATTETVKTGCPAGYFCPGTNVSAGATPVDGMMGATSCKTYGDMYTSDANTIVPLAEETLGAGGVANMKQRMTDAGLDASVAKFGCYANVPAGSYKNGSGDKATLETCPAGTWSGAHRSYISIATTDAECNACPAGYISGDATGLTSEADCFGGYKFELTTTAGTSSFNINISAAGNFVIDWDDGNVEPVINETPTNKSVPHTYATAGTYTIKIGGLATGYDVEAITENGVPVVSFSSSKIASIDGSIGAIFPTLQNGDQPGFYGTFSGSKITSLPPTLFKGIHGAGVSMFASTFYGCEALTEIPAELFSGISGAAWWMFGYTFRGCTSLTEIPVGLFDGVYGAAANMFYSTFGGCTGLSSIPAGLFSGVSGAAKDMFSYTFNGCTSLMEIPVGLFSGVTGAAAEMFSGTFNGCTGLSSIPAGLFSGVSGAAEWMFASTFRGCTSLTEIPVGLFDGVAGVETLPDYMFYQTFYNNTSLTGPAAKMSADKGGQFLHDIWPMTGATWETYSGATGLDDWDYIPTSWGGGGQAITCAAGTYLPANATACVTCTAGNYCDGLTGVVPSDANQGIKQCPAGYTNSADGAVNIGWCYMNLAAGYYRDGRGYSQMLHEIMFRKWSEDQVVYYDHYSAMNFCPNNMHNGGMDYENTELFDSEYDACYKKYSGQIVEKVIPMVKSITFDSLDYDSNVSAINVDDIYVYVDDGNGVERKLSQDELKSYLSNEDEFAAWFDGQYATPIELTSATLNFNTALPIVRVGVRIYDDRDIGYQSDTGGWRSNHLQITLTDSDEKTGVHSYYGLRDDGATASLTYGTPGPVHTFPTVYYAQKACPSGTYKEEYVARVNTTYTCDACAPAPDGGVVASVAPYDAPTTCYVPAQSELKDGKGTYVFTDRCMYK